MTFEIEIDGLDFSYKKGEKILDNICLCLEKGKFHTILGPNGSGKTTLLKNIAKLLPMEKGSIRIGGRSLEPMKSKALAKMIAVVPQYTAVEFDFTAYEIVMMGRTPYLPRFSEESGSDQKVVQRAMELTNTWGFRDKSIQELSGGERQRVIVARAIAQETEIILLDEPISHLDIHHQVEILNNIRTLNRTENKTIIAVLHDLNLASAYSDNIVLMQHGKIHSMGAPDQVLTSLAVKEIYGLEVQIATGSSGQKPFIIPKYEQ